jgi:6-phosphogluconolactonase (cycloisomerase 2 family)
MKHLIRLLVLLVIAAVLIIGMPWRAQALPDAPGAIDAPGIDLPLPNIIVNTTGIPDDPNDSKCDLWEALQAVFQANYGMTPTYHECTAKPNAMNIIAFSVVGGTITVPAAGPRTDLPFVHGETVIVGPITIAGSGAAADTHLLRTAPGAKLTVVAAVLKNGHTSGGGPAIYSDNGATVNVIASFLIDNVADQSGGAILANGELNLIGTSFVNNRANGSPGYGGAVYMSGSGTFKSEASTFTANKANAGGAIYLEKNSGEASIGESIFTANIATGDANKFGGGAVYHQAGRLTIERTAFNANIGLQGKGGALFNNTNAVMTVTSTLFDGNIAGDIGATLDGGAIMDLGTLNVGRSTFVANVATGGNGGAIATAANAQVSIANTTFSSNLATELGGALIISGTGTTVIRNSTLANNIAGASATTLYVWNSAHAQLGNTILDRGLSPQSNCAGTTGITSLGHNIDSDGSCGLLVSGDLILPPLLDNLAFNGGSLPILTTHKPSYSSPAVDNGDSAICADPAVNNEDEIGTKRPKDANNTGSQACDIGAVELEARKPAFDAVPLPPGPINFGSVQVNTTVTTNLTVKNSGNYQMLLSNPSLSDIHFGLTNTFPITLFANAQNNLVLTCRPTATGPLTGTLSFDTTDPERPNVAYTLLCNGTPAAQPGFSSAPAAVVPLEFGEVTVGQTATKTITIKNIGNATLSLTSVAWSGAPGLNHNFTTPLNIAPGETQVLSPTCKPVEPGLLAGYLTVSTNDSAQPAVDFTINCSGSAPQSDALFNSQNLKSPLFLPGDLSSLYGLAVSPDSANAYLSGAAAGGGQIVVLKRLASGSFLWTSQVTRTQLATARGVSVSPDGKYVLGVGASQNALVSYARESGDGGLTYLGYAQNGVGGVTGMSYPWEIAFSPDSQFAYVTGYSSDSIAIFKQNDAAASKFSFVGSIASTTMSTHTLAGPTGIIVSPDGKNLYAVASVYGSGTGVLAVYQRNTSTGLLTPIQTRYQGDCQDAIFICLFGLDGLDGAYQVVVSPDGRNLYVTGQANNSLTTFTRDPVKGTVRRYSTLVDSTGAYGLRSARGAAVSADGKHVYSIGNFDQAMTVFNRSSANGSLSLREVYKRDAGTQTPALAGANLVAATADGEYVFANAITDNAFVAFRAANPRPTLTSLQPASVVAGSSAFTLTVKGKDFVKGAQVKWDGIQQPTTTFVNASEMRAVIPATWIVATGQHTISVHNYSPGGGDSFNWLNFQITSAALNASSGDLGPQGVDVAGTPIPSIDHLSPAGVKAGSPETQVDIYGSNFLNTAQVTINNTLVTPTVLDSTHLRVSIGASKLAQAGTLNLLVRNAVGADSNLVGLDVAPPGDNAIPTVTGASPEWVFARGASGKAIEILIIGSGFVDGALGQWNGEDRPTEFVDSTHVRVTLYGLDQFSASSNGIAVTNPAPGGGVSNVLTFEIHPLFNRYLPIIRR